MDNREQKQAYLRQYILEKGYDANEFIQFLNRKAPIGDDLDLIAFAELKAIVKQFVGQGKQQESSFEPLAQMTQSAVQIPSKNQKSSNKSKAILYGNYTPNVLEHEFVKSYECKKVIDKYASVPVIKCIVSNPERKNTGGVFGIGSTSFLQFKVNTPQLKWKVGRRYSDFIWLRTYLLRVYPSYILPPIPEKKASKRTQRHIQKRMKILENFLNDLISKRELLNDKFVQGFLSLPDLKSFENLKKQAQKVKNFQGLGDARNLKGEVDSKLSQQNKIFIEEIPKQVPTIQKIYKNITRGGKSLQALFTQEVNTLYEIGNHFADLHEVSKDLTNRFPKAEGMKSLNNIYITLNNMMIQWGNILRNQHQFIQNNFNTFFKYVRNELYGFSELATKQQDLQTQYMKTKINLDKKKQKIYSLHDPHKWELSSKELSTLPKQYVHNKVEALRVMLPKQVAALQKMRIKMYFFLQEFYIHSNENFKHNGTRFCDNFKQFSIKMKVNTQQLSQMWLEMSANFSSPGEKAQFVKHIPDKQESSQDEYFYDD